MQSSCRKDPSGRVIARRSAEPTFGRRTEAAGADDDWRERLSPEQFRVLRKRGTEAPFSNQAVVPDAEGMYRCAACDAALFRADTKFDPGTGWPSFTASEPDGVELHRDFRPGCRALRSSAVAAAVTWACLQ